MMYGKCVVRGLIGTVLAFGACGCADDGHPSLLPNPDANLHKTSAEFAADAAKRHYEADAPRGEQSGARGQYELMSRKVDIVNLGDLDLENVEVWINHEYVLFIPTMPKGVDEKLDFEMFFDRDGHHFETQGGKNPLQMVEIYMDGKMYDVKVIPD